MYRRPLLLLCIVPLAAWASALRLSPPPPLSTGGGEVLFLLFTLDNPGGAGETVLEARFPDGFRLLSARERQLRPGTNLLPLSVEVGAGVPAGDYLLCLRLEGEPGEACAAVQVSPREALELDVPREVYGAVLHIGLANRGNEPRTLAIRAEGSVSLEPVRVALPPGASKALDLPLEGTGDLLLHIGDRLVLVRVRDLDGRPPPKLLTFGAEAAYDPLSGGFRPGLTVDGDLSDYAHLSGRLWPQPRLRLDWAPVSISAGHLLAPYDGWGLRAGYGSPWALELGAGNSDERTVIGAGLVYHGASPGHLRFLYDGSFWAEGAVENLPLGDWRLAAALDKNGLEAEIEQQERDLDFGLGYDFTGGFRLSAGFGEGEARGRLSYEHGQEDRLELSLDSGPVNWTVAGVWKPFRLDWSAGYHEDLGPGRYGLLVGARGGGPLVGGSYALKVPFVPGLGVAAAVQYAGDWQLGGALSYQLAPWSAALSYAGGAAGLQLGYKSDGLELNLDAALGREPRVSLSASTSLDWALPEPAVTALGGRSWARLEGRVQLADGSPVAGLMIDAGGRRVVSGPDGRYVLWLPAGPVTLRLLRGDALRTVILPQPRQLVLDEAARRHLDFELAPAGALRLDCTGVPPGAQVGLNLFGTASSLVACGHTAGGLPAGTYRLQPFGLGSELTAEHPATVEIVSGETTAVALALTPRPPPQITRPELVLRTPSLLTAAPGETLSVEVESNAPLVYATLPGGARRALVPGPSGRLRLEVAIPFDFAGPLFRLRLSAVSEEGRLERQTLIRIDPRRPLFDTELEPAQGAAGDSVLVTVETRFTPEAVRLSGPDLALELDPASPGLYQGRFVVPASWAGREDVTLTLILEGSKRLEETYRFRMAE